jgi:hypothetical protein
MDYKCPLCHGTTHNDDSCANPSCLNQLCCNKPLEECNCNVFPALSDEEILEMLLDEHEHPHPFDDEDDV